MAMLTRRLRAGQFTVHGFRSSFRDWAAETGVVFEVAEASLAHAIGSKSPAPICEPRCSNADGRSWLRRRTSSAAPVPTTWCRCDGARRVSELRRAIAIRQPFAWAVIHAGKDVENRRASGRRLFESAVGERVLIHASKGMTADEYENATAIIASIGVRCPQREALQFGCVIGSVFVRDIVTRSDSPWFRKGATALVFADARPEPFMPVRGQTGLFWVRSA
jgi:hypothetical protein